MDDYGVTPEIARLMDAAQDALSRVWSADVRLYLQEPIRSDWGRHIVLLCNVAGPDGTPPMVVIKAASTANNAIFNEWAVLDWLNRIEHVAPLVPTLYAGDVETQLIVVEDVGAGPSLQRILQTRPDWAREALLESQELMGVVHSATRGRQAEFVEARAALPSGPSPAMLSVTAASLRSALEAWAGSLSAGVVAELADIGAVFDVPPSFRTLTFFDACPVNRLVTSAGLRAIDLEMAGFRHPMIDGAYAAMGHLRCSIPRLRPDAGLGLPAELKRIGTEVYRSALLTGFPEYEDVARFNHDLCAAAALWMIEILRRMRARTEGQKPQRFFGVTPCQRVLATLSAFAELALSHQRLPELASWALAERQRLEAVWPDYPVLADVSAWR